MYWAGDSIFLVEIHPGFTVHQHIYGIFTGVAPRLYIVRVFRVLDLLK